MKAVTGERPVGGAWALEVKWDGTDQALLAVDARRQARERRSGPMH
jgi:hypothetical protein